MCQERKYADQTKLAMKGDVVFLHSNEKRGQGNFREPRFVLFPPPKISEFFVPPYCCARAGATGRAFHRSGGRTQKPHIVHTDVSVGRSG